MTMEARRRETLPSNHRLHPSKSPSTLSSAEEEELMQTDRIDREPTPSATTRDHADPASGLDAFVKALFQCRPAVVAPPAREPRPGAAERHRGVPILARSLFRDLVHNGFEAAHLVALSTELLELTTSMVRVRAAVEQGRHVAGADLSAAGPDARGE
jgi:hypothetical protein